ncbi:helix-turn-helix domain-containing protein [Neobacillus sp. SM06]|uniref:helix-turn-helix domain-containing protein n=1 Tax=Neobacillus sp. SM06 TaxID=3422492 RepID=UPI003D2C4BDA
MKLIEGIILYCLYQLNGERTIYSIYHLFKGKKSSQTIQDAHLYGIKKYFGVYHPITREMLEEWVGTAFNRGVLEQAGDQRFILSAQGKIELESFLKNNHSLAWLNGWKYQQTGLFWERLSLLVQVISNLVKRETNYLPIQKNKNAHEWLKHFLRTSGYPRAVIGRKLYEELVACLENPNVPDPHILVVRFTGHQQIGLTSSQAADSLQLDLPSYHIKFATLLHYMIRQLAENAKAYPLLSRLAADLNPDQSLTLSARRTQSFLYQGYSLEEIANIRGLKISTIEDHVVEIALNDEQFSIDHYIEKPVQEKILLAARQGGSRQLKQIRNTVQTANYFEIRLVLAKYGVAQC